MATPSGLNATPINPTGLTTENLAKYEEALKASADALQARYESPNWFNVAAGFLKPQLGGFAASLGSAGAALGDWQEKQRANELPVAQMRAELGKVGMLQSQQNQANSLINAHKGPVTPELVQKVTALVGEGNPMAKSLADQLTATRADITNVTSRRAQDADRFKTAQATGIDPMTGLKVTDLGAFANKLAADRGEPTTAAPVLPIAAPAGAPGIVPAPGAAGASPIAIPSIALGPKGENEGPALKELRSINGMSPGADKDAAMADFASKHPMNAPTTSALSNKPEPSAKTEYIQRSVPKIDTTGMTGPEAAAANEAYVAGVKAKQEQYSDQAKRLLSAASFDTTQDIENPAKRIVTTAEKNPAVFSKVHDLVNEQGGPLAAAIQKGFNVHLPGTGSIGVGIDVREIIKSNFPAHERAIAEHLISDYMRLGVANANRSGVSPTSLAQHPSSGESQAMMLAASGIQQTPDAALLGVQLTLNDLAKRKDEKKTYEKLYRKTDPHSPTRDADVLQHPEFESIYKYYAERNANTHNEFLDAQAKRAAKIAAKAKGTP